MAVGDNKLDIYNMAERILIELNSTFMEYDEILPEKQFIYVGEMPPHDCEQVTVGFLQHYSGPPGAQAQEPATCNDVRTAAFTVELVRACAPGLVSVTNETTNKRYGSRMETPGSEDYNAYARQRLIDSTLIMEAGMRIVGNGTVGGLADVSVGNISGGYQAVILNLFVMVE